MLKDIDQNEVAKYNHINALQLLKDTFKHNKIEANINKSQYRFLMSEGLIVRGTTGLRHGMVYLLTDLGVKELRELGVDVKPDPLRKCRRCGREAFTESDLEDFMLNWSGKHHRNNMCKVCEKNYQRDMRGMRIE